MWVVTVGEVAEAARVVAEEEAVGWVEAVTVEAAAAAEATVVASAKTREVEVVVAAAMEVAATEAEAVATTAAATAAAQVVAAMELVAWVVVAASKVAAAAAVATAADEVGELNCPSSRRAPRRLSAPAHDALLVRPLLAGARRALALPTQSKTTNLNKPSCAPLPTHV